MNALDMQAREEAFKLCKIAYFTPFEFLCKCGNPLCGDESMDMEFVELLDKFRSYTGIPMRITSGYRCGFHPNEEHKVHPGPHRTGKAADSAIVGVSCHEILYELGWFNSTQEDQSQKFLGIGLNQKGDHDERFIHLDICDAKPYRPRPHVWTY